MENILKDMVIKRQHGIHCGIPSFCCANRIVIEAVLEQARRFDDITLIEATSNQVNQDGGYMNMKPQDFADYVYKIADKLGVSRNTIILGGDHMGPLPWVDSSEETAMEKAKELVYQCVKAGYKKIHLDTSMKLSDDKNDEKLSNYTIAERGAILYMACERAYEEMLLNNPEEVHPVFVIGSEVPVPGGTDDEKIDGMQITEPQEFSNTLMAYKDAFHKYGLDSAWENIIAVVVQPGVEFSNETIHKYNRNDARNLCNELKKYPDIVFEGHSTDYQPPELLRQMVEDGIAIIKVGPALTFSLREALFALNMIEEELNIENEKKSHFREILEKEMIEEPQKWIQYYDGDLHEQYLKREYSYSDRSRYYMSKAVVEEAINKLFFNIDSMNIPLSMLKQYMPYQYIKVRDGKIEMKARELVKDSVVNLVEDYNYAVKYNYMISGIFVR